MPDNISRVARCGGWIVPLTALLVSCGQAPPAPAPVSTDPVGLWRATLALPGGELPFGLEFARNADGTLTATLINGPERLKVTDIRQQDTQLELAIPAIRTSCSPKFRATCSRVKS